MRIPILIVTLFTVLVAAAVAQTAPGKGVRDVVASAAALEVEPSRVDFVCVLAGEDSVRAITWRNTGASAVTIFEFVTTPPFVAPPDRDLVLQPGTSITRDLHYTPISPATHAATLVARTSDGDVSIPLVGRTGFEPTLEISPTSLEFNEVEIGSEATLCVAIHNPSCRPLAMSSVRFDLEPWVFSVQRGLRDMVIDGFERDTVCVRFRPTMWGGVGDILRIRSADGQEGTVPVTGFGARVDLRVASALDFGSVVLGAQRELPLTVSNEGEIPVRITTPPVISGANVGDFQVVGLRLPATISRGIPLTLRIVFAPGALGDRNATLSLENSSASVPTVALHGVGTTSQVVVSPDSIDMGDVLVGLDRTALQVIVIDNRGPTTVRLDTLVITGADSANFGLNGFVIAPIAARDRLMLDVRFAPTAGRVFLARADGKLSDGSRFSIPLRGRGVLPEPPKDRVIWADTASARVGERARVHVRIVPDYVREDSIQTVSVTLRVDPRALFPHRVIAPAGRTATMSYDRDGTIRVQIRAGDSSIAGSELFELELEGLYTGRPANNVGVETFEVTPFRGQIDGVDGLVRLSGCDVEPAPDLARIVSAYVDGARLVVRIAGAGLDATCRLVAADGRVLNVSRPGAGESTIDVPIHRAGSCLAFLELRSGDRVDVRPVLIIR